MAEKLAETDLSAQGDYSTAAKYNVSDHNTRRIQTQLLITAYFIFLLINDI